MAVIGAHCVLRQPERTRAVDLRYRSAACIARGVGKNNCGSSLVVAAAGYNRDLVFLMASRERSSVHNFGWCPAIACSGFKIDRSHVVNLSVGYCIVVARVGSPQTRAMSAN